MESASRFIEKKLRLKVNQEKSAVGRPWERKYLGFCVTNSHRNPKIRIHRKTIRTDRLGGLKMQIAVVRQKQPPTGFLD